MNNVILKILTSTVLFVSTGAHAENLVMAYDIANALTRPGTLDSNFYSGTITFRNARYNYSGGRGTLNDGITGGAGANRQYFVAGDDAIVTLHLSEKTAISDINFFGGQMSGRAESMLSHVTATIGGKSLNLSLGGPPCVAGVCHTSYSFAGTAFDGVMTDTIILNNFGAHNQIAQFYLSEISVNGIASAVPEPQTYAMMFAGIGLLGFTARRRKKVT